MALDLVGFVLPFVFILAIVYGALDVAGTFKKKSVNIIIAVVVAAFAIINTDVIAFIIAIMPLAAMLFIAIFFIKFVLSMFKVKRGEERDYTLIIVILGLLAVFMLSHGTELVEDWLPGGFPITEENLILIIGIILIIAIIMVAYRSKGETPAVK
jgi:hypothetical protein